MKGVPVEAVCFCESSFNDGGERWTAPYLYRIAKERGLVPETVILRHVDLSARPWKDTKNVGDFVYHCHRAMASDCDIPIIMSWDGSIMDGWHRILKAVVTGRKTLKAYRFEKYVEPDGKDEEADDAKV